MVALLPWKHDPLNPGHRVISALTSASILTSRPSNIPIPRTRGVKAEGRRYERLVGKKLLEPNSLRLQMKTGAQIELRSSVWFEFLDANGRGVCEADHLIICPDRVVVVEVKLTQTPRGISQLKHLYLPCARHVFKEVPVLGVMVCKTLYEQPEALVGSFSEVLKSDPNVIPTWHWLGR